MPCTQKLHWVSTVCYIDATPLVTEHAHLRQKIQQRADVEICWKLLIKIQSMEIEPDPCVSDFDVSLLKTNCLVFGTKLSREKFECNEVNTFEWLYWTFVENW